MGEVAEMVINGELCEGCGVYLEGEPPGHPRHCKDCKNEKGAKMSIQLGLPEHPALDFPITTKVAGISRHQKALENVVNKTFFILYREPNNPHDANAIAVKAWGKYDLGYIPRDLAEKLAPLLDEGKASRKATFVRKNVSEKHPDRVGLSIKIHAKKQ